MPELPPTATPKDGRVRVIIEGLSPEIDGGRFPAKRTLGDKVRVEADIFTDGHDSIAAVLAYKHASESSWREVAMQALVNDRWTAEFTAAELGRYAFTVHAWVDHWETWRRDLQKRIKAETDTPLDYLIGADLIDAAASRATTDHATQLTEFAKNLRLQKDQSTAEGTSPARETALAPALNELALRYPDRRHAAKYHRDLQIVVDPVRARFSAWYEFFPRSAANEPGKHGTFADCEARLPYVAGMGFDVLYFPPIHPIGFQFRKGRNNTVTAEPDDVGSPWAIGAPTGGHKSILAELGTLDDFRRLVKKASGLGIQIALDIAFQVAPDHPYVKEHENWFRKRPDGTIQYAENPPKKYQDIYPFDFESEDWDGMWKELKSVFEFWIEQGVRIFRVDNPHTKAFPFWEWCITELKRKTPEVLFLSEAFTRPKIMYRLAKLGFSQSYTYFPWRNAKYELTTYLTELSKPPVSEFFRPNQWPNTPDILTEFFQSGMKSAFMIRYLLAATLGANYGIYGPAFELLEGRPVRAGSEEYLDSEKYQLRLWNLDKPDSLRELITLVNRIRRENPALQSDRNLVFHPVSNDQLICFSKRTEAADNVILMVVNLDPYRVQSGFVDLPLDLLKIEETVPYQAHDLITGARYLWTGRRNYVELDPAILPAHILRLRRRVRAENDFEYFL
jgi:starch synthase (maltosyl-transferring)